MVATGYLKVQVLEHEQRLNPNTEFKHMMKHPVRDLKKKKISNRLSHSWDATYESVLH